MDEYTETRILANKVLDRINGDPDDDLAILSRQLLRADERAEFAADLFTNIAQILDVVKQEWAESWSAWDQEQRDGISRILNFHYQSRSGLKLEKRA